MLLERTIYIDKRTQIVKYRKDIRANPILDDNLAKFLFGDLVKIENPPPNYQIQNSGLLPKTAPNYDTKKC